MTSSLIFDLSITSLIAKTCVGDLCLVGGDSRSGNLYIRDKPVCDDYWDKLDAQVVCKGMGLGEVKRVTKSSEYDLILQFNK